MKCEFCEEDNHAQGVAGLVMLIDAIMDGEWTGKQPIEDAAHAAWRDFRRGGSLTLPYDPPLLSSWLDRISR